MPKLRLEVIVRKPCRRCGVLWRLRMRRLDCYTVKGVPVCCKARAEVPPPEARS